MSKQSSSDRQRLGYDITGTPSVPTLMASQGGKLAIQIVHAISRYVKFALPICSIFRPILATSQINGIGFCEDQGWFWQRRLDQSIQPGNPLLLNRKYYYSAFPLYLIFSSIYNLQGFDVMTLHSWLKGFRTTGLHKHPIL